MPRIFDTLVIEACVDSAEGIIAGSVSPYLEIAYLGKEEDQRSDDGRRMVEMFTMYAGDMELLLDELKEHGKVHAVKWMKNYIKNLGLQNMPLLQRLRLIEWIEANVVTTEKVYHRITNWKD
jgi:hypothetical protein